MGCYIWYSEMWTGPRPHLAVPNVTAHPSTASVPITLLLYNGLLLCGFNVDNVGIKGLMGVSGYLHHVCKNPKFGTWL